MLACYDNFVCNSHIQGCIYFSYSEHVFHSSMSGFEEMIENFSQNEIRQMISKVSPNVIISSIVTVTQMMINKLKVVGQPI